MLHLPVWISETMLQQTKVATVLPYYARFLEAFPTVQALSEAESEQVLELWAGLGYYSRARRLHEASQIIVSKYDGKIPEDPVLMQKELPGVGRYTAGAVSSIAYGVAAPVVDGNV